MKETHPQCTQLCASPSPAGTVGPIHCQPSPAVTHLSLHPSCCQGFGRLCVNITLPSLCGSQLQTCVLCEATSQSPLRGSQTSPGELSLQKIKSADACFFFFFTHNSSGRNPDREGLQSTCGKSWQLMSLTKWRRGVLIKGYSLGSSSHPQAKTWVGASSHKWTFSVVASCCFPY